MDAPEPVDAYVARVIAPAFQDVVAALRALLGQALPHATESISYGIPMWKANGPVAWITPSRTHVSLGFRHGVYFGDAHGLLRGTGKHARHVRLKRLADLNEAALRDYLAQAVEWDLKSAV
jgi:hypothetical protein